MDVQQKFVMVHSPTYSLVTSSRQAHVLYALYNQINISKNIPESLHLKNVFQLCLSSSDYILKCFCAGNREVMIVNVIIDCNQQWQDSIVNRPN